MDSAKLLLDFPLLNGGKCLLSPVISLEISPEEMTLVIDLRGFIQNSDSTIYHLHREVDKGDS